MLTILQLHWSFRILLIISFRLHASFNCTWTIIVLLWLCHFSYGYHQVTGIYIKFIFPMQPVRYNTNSGCLWFLQVRSLNSFVAWWTVNYLPTWALQNFPLPQCFTYIHLKEKFKKPGSLPQIEAMAWKFPNQIVLVMEVWCILRT